jgi:hypothetical protein
VKLVVLHTYRKLNNVKVSDMILTVKIRINNRDRRQTKDYSVKLITNNLQSELINLNSSKMIAEYHECLLLELTVTVCSFFTSSQCTVSKCLCPFSLIRHFFQNFISFKSMSSSLFHLYHIERDYH